MPAVPRVRAGRQLLLAQLLLLRPVRLHDL